jgi:hypothetical protein
MTRHKNHPEGIALPQVSEYILMASEQQLNLQ